MSQNGKLMPNLDQNSTKLLNLTVLQRIDPFVEEILITAAHVTLYEFNIDNSQWSRKDVEGSLFVVKRSAQPRFQFIVMNRRNTDNLVEDLLGDFEFELQIPYLLYRNSSQDVNGIWFYNSRECEEVANLFNRILSAYSKVPAKFKLPSNKSEFEELEAVPSMSVMDGPLEPSSTTSNTADVPDDRSFVNFFSNAMRIGSGPNAGMQGQPYDSSAVVLPPPRPPAVPPSSAPALSPSSPLSTSSTLMPVLDAPEPDTNSRRSSNLVKPSSFFGPPPSSSPLIPPVSSAVPTAPPLQSPGNLQRHYGAPLLQPFPPPNLPPSLTPYTAPGPNNGHVINRDKVREALLMLVQDDQFIDIVYRAILNAHHT
ncbi:mRNA-decapping enzyme-like protein [Capsicum annuum]|uniref:mRNA-decapping enzyme-like protein n=1 Tax=Capsicum annuum TaxID=4072 RepID=A0A1U8FAD0_CAPAN|nr:mRNA-decapping enzyme-like protein [Capsicum annuum]KAF3657192.1 mRNA-decapping enzyme-like protein [Capsicum annuum]PHT93998.1 mRNA-decapping enzyme-like protein [Capsicum annuum]